MCWKFCNPAPLNGSAPNLVVVATDQDGNQYYKQAFNTQACEQLNAWLGGFEPILRRLTIDNFNWFLHTMLVYHTQYVSARIIQKEAKRNARNSENVEDEDEGEEDESNDALE